MRRWWVLFSWSCGRLLFVCHSFGVSEDESCKVLQRTLVLFDLLVDHCKSVYMAVVCVCVYFVQSSLVLLLYSLVILGYLAAQIGGRSSQLIMFLIRILD